MEKYFSIKQAAKAWGLSERSVRNYCEDGRIFDAKKMGGEWKIPKFAKKPERKNQKSVGLVEVLRREGNNRIKGGIYHQLQIDLTYNSNHMEGSRLSKDQTRYIFETNTILPENKKLKGIIVDDIVETANHFRCIDYIIDNVNRKISVSMVKKLHLILKNGTTDSLKDWFNVGEYKKMPNEVGGEKTTAPEKVPEVMKKLIEKYNTKKKLGLDDLLEFHYRFEKIHPFQDGNGRVGRLILFKECLRLGIVPFIIDDEIKGFYYRGLKEWRQQRGYLRETCLHAQDKFKEVLDYYRIEH